MYARGYITEHVAALKFLSQVSFSNFSFSFSIDILIILQCDGNDHGDSFSADFNSLVWATGCRAETVGDRAASH